MSNTLKFGNGEWYGKEGTILAYNSENNNYKPLPFTFDRASSATRVNKEGLIETVGADEPRVDYLNDSNGALLLEPSRTNLITYSEDFTNASWTKLNSTITSNDIISPDGNVNADKIESTGTSSSIVFVSYPTITLTNTYTAFTFIKKGDNRWIRLGHNTSAIGAAWFDLDNGVTGTVNCDSANIEELSNGWYKCSITFIASVSSGSSVFFIGLSDADNSTNVGTVGKFNYIYGAQLEQGSYPTSIIKTQGSIGTRAADSCNQTPPSGIIGQTEGTVFLDVNFETLSDLNMFLSIRPNSSNKIEVYRDGDIIYGEISASTSFSISNTNITVGRYKIALAYSSGSTAMYINGNLISNRTTSFAFTSTLDEIYINSRGASFIEQSNYNEVKLYNTRLSNSELAALTT